MTQLNRDRYIVEMDEPDANGYVTKLNVLVNEDNRVHSVNINAEKGDWGLILEKKEDPTYNHLMKVESGITYADAAKDLEMQVFLKLNHYDQLKDTPFQRVKGARFLTKDVQELFRKLIEETDIIVKEED